MAKFLWIWVLIAITLTAAEPQVRLFDSVQIETNFDGEPPKHSYGMLLEGGYVLASESSLFKQGNWARNNRIKILDTLGYPMIYFALLEPYAIDRDQKIVLYKIIAFTDPYGNQTEMNRFHLEILKTRGASFIPKDGSAKRKKNYKIQPQGGGIIPKTNIPRITKAQKSGTYYLANEERVSKSILFYPYTRKGLEKITKSQLEVYLKEYEKVPKDLIFYTEQKKPAPPKIIDVSSELKAVSNIAKTEKPLTGMYAMTSLSNLYPPNPVGAPVWNGNGDFEGIIIASRPQDNLMLSHTQVFEFFCAVAARSGYEEALQKRILRNCPQSFKK